MATKRTPKWLSAARAAQGKPDDWLERALGRAGVPQAKHLIFAGAVRLDGVTCREPFTPVVPSSEVVVKGRRVDVTPVTRVAAFHKPAGLVTDAVDQHGQGTVFEAFGRALPEALAGYFWHAVGRLDRDTTGLLLFTTDERFVAHATQPATHLPKRYVATVGTDATDEKLAALAQGVELDDGPTRPAAVQRRAARVVELTLTEGRYHQVKRMLGALGLPTLALHREAIGSYVLDVPLGAARLLEPDEVRRHFGFEPRGVGAQSS